MVLFDVNFYDKEHILDSFGLECAFYQEVFLGYRL